MTLTWERVVGALKKVTVEPFIFLVMFAYSVRIVSMQSLLHDRACRVSLGYPDALCDSMDAQGNEAVQEEAVKYGNNLYNGLIMMSTVPALVVATLLGPWSDRYSRKIPLMISTAGIFIDNTAQAVLTSYPHASPYLYLACATISGLSGGLLITISSSYSYMSDVTNERSRQTRFAVLEFFTMMATPAGSFIGGQVYSLGGPNGYLYVLCLPPISSGAAWLWVTFYLKETKQRDPDVDRKTMLRDLFNLQNTKESYKTCCKPRPGNLRLQIWLLVFISCSLRLINLGSIAIGFPYTRKTFKWDVERYSYTTTVFSLLNSVATISIVPLLNRRLLVHEAAVGLIGILSLMAKMTIMSATVVEGLIFYAWLSGCLFACGGIAVRSRISKLVDRSEMGKVFSLLGTFEAPTPVLGTVIMTQLYNVSVNVSPGLVYAVAAVLLVPSAVIFAWMMRLPTMSFVQYQESEEVKTMKEMKNVSSNVL